MEKYCRGGEATEDNISHEHCTLYTEGYTYSEYVVFTTFPRQKSLYECALMLPCTYIACLVRVCQEPKCLFYEPELCYIHKAWITSNSGIEISAGYGTDSSRNKLAGGLSNHLIYYPTQHYVWGTRIYDLTALRSHFCKLCYLWLFTLSHFT